MRTTRLKPILDKITRDEYRTIDISDLREAALIKNSGWQDLMNQPLSWIDLTIYNFTDIINFTTVVKEGI